MFKKLKLFTDIKGHSGIFQMALDEVLLARFGAPCLRFYAWDRPTVSFGYFENLSEIEAVYGSSHALVRRWTGGGVVVHGDNDGDDITYSLIVPREWSVALGAPADVYRLVHGAVARVLDEAGASARLVGGGAGDGEGKAGERECFRSPVASDVMVGGSKVAGAGLRRSRAGLLHQGSIQGVKVPSDFGARLAGVLAGEVKVIDRLPEEIVGEAELLAESKYGTEGWLRRFE